jgi:hypothetical protein
MTALFEPELAMLRVTVYQCIPEPPPTVRLALNALLAGEDCPAHAATVAAIAPGLAGASLLGAALELMNISLHRLHEGLDRSPRTSFCLSAAGDILVGDLLSSAAFRLLVQVDSMPIMRMVSAAIQKACEIEVLALQEATAEYPPFAVVSVVVRRTSALGAAAGETAALLAGYDAAVGKLAGQFGHALATTVYWTAQARIETCPEQIEVYRELARESLTGAEDAAARFAQRTGGRDALLLSERFRRGELGACGHIAGYAK